MRFLGPLAPSCLGGMTILFRVVLVWGVVFYYSTGFEVEVVRDHPCTMNGHVLGVNWQGVGRRKRSCFRCGLPRAESERILRSNPKGRIREVPPREEYFMGRPSPLKQNFDPPTRRKRGPRPTSQPAGGDGMGSDAY